MNWWHYLLLVNIYLVLFYSFYVLLLQRETFFQLNRIYLVAAVIFSFFIPVIQANWVKNLFITQKVQYTLYSSPITIYQFEPIKEPHITIGQVLVSIYLAGLVFLTARFIWQLIVLKRAIATQKLSGPYSFFKKINLDDDQNEYQVVAVHEHVHAAQWHSVDVLLMEVVVLINWFNPVVHLYRLAIKHVHEFIADRQAIQSGTDKSAYALLLLSQTFNSPVNQLVNQFFNHSLLKQRIIMLQKNKSQRIALIKYGFSAPLFILMLILSSATLNNSKTIKLLSRKATNVFLMPAATGSVNIHNRDAEHVNDADNIIRKIQEKHAGAKIEISVPIADTTAPEENRVFTAVEIAPEFPGGITAFSKFLSQNLKYPEAMRKAGVQGRVIVEFVVERDGSLTGIKVIKGIGYGADEEAIRVLNLSPKWERGVQNGRPVRVSYAVPISFVLNEKQVNSTGSQFGATNENTSSAGSSTTFIGIKTDSGKWAQPFDDGPNKPLIIVDGKEMSEMTRAEQRAMDPHDIVSVSVLKDQSAISLYGSKGANGVVIITTKKHATQSNPVKP